MVVVWWLVGLLVCWFVCWLVCWWWLYLFFVAVAVAVVLFWLLNLVLLSVLLSVVVSSSGIGGTVNPICGLRGDAKELWTSVRAKDETRVRLTRTLTV